MALFDIPKKPENTITETQTASTSKIKLKKGQTIQDLVVEARKLVLEKLGNYKDASKCITNIKDLEEFFNNTPDGAEIGLDTETTRLERAEYNYIVVKTM